MKLVSNPRPRARSGLLDAPLVMVGVGLVRISSLWLLRGADPRVSLEAACVFQVRGRGRGRGRGRAGGGAGRGGAGRGAEDCR